MLMTTGCWDDGSVPDRVDERDDSPVPDTFDERDDGGCSASDGVWIPVRRCDITALNWKLMNIISPKDRAITDDC
jgi:hypothetical protein